jgi:hypothetical protein
VTVGLTVMLGQAGLGRTASAEQPPVSPVLEWNQIFIDTLIATNTANSSSQRLGAIVHTAIFDSLNGVERRYSPIFVHDKAPRGASRRAAVIAAAYTALVGLFPSQQAALDARYQASLAAQCDDGEHAGQSCELGIKWGTWVAQAVLAWRATDGFSASYPPFSGGTEVGQWRPTTRVRSHEAQGCIHEDVRSGQQHPVQAWTTAESGKRQVHARFRRRQGARPQDRVDAH